MPLVVHVINRIMVLVYTLFTWSMLFGPRMDFITLETPCLPWLSISSCIVVQVGVEDKDVGRMLVKYPWILSTSIQENFKEVLSFFDLEKVRNPIRYFYLCWPIFPTVMNHYFG